ncbi:lymphocyte antigen 6 complex locus protein G6c [Pelodiscus sinensis]|uniref:lymphocyte antigen 6 complex locus protein G6c n=1 Tax=Pelodiscus sinensis TaxID=13735 RepID=UPI003F6C701A
MHHVVFLGLTLLLLCSQAAGLMCRVCKFQVGVLCFHPKDPCEADFGQSCETTKAYIGKVPLFSKYGCNKRTKSCNVTEVKDDVFDVSYNRTCCETNLCNAAGSPPSGLPLLSGLGAVLGLWLLK